MQQIDARKGWTRFSALVLAGLASTAAPALAAPIIGTAGNGLRTIGTAQENLVNYWDGNSWDSNSTPDGSAFNPCSAGSLATGWGCGLNEAASGVAARAGLTGTTFGLATSHSDFQAWGSESGSADGNFTFGNVAGGAWYDFDLLGEFTDDWQINEIGWYEIGNPQNRHTIFSAMQNVGSIGSAFITGDFGFYYRNTGDPSEMFFTQSAFNTIGDRQQFAAFQYLDYTILGVEDIFSHVITSGWQPGTADYDFNDVMIGFRARPVPEPGTLLLVGMGLVGAAARRFRRSA